MVQPDLIEYKCPQCGGVLEFDSASQQMKCPYCDSVFSVEALQSKDEALENTVDGQWQPPETTFDESETAHMGVYTCKSCGGEIVADETTGATHCPYCDTDSILTLDNNVGAAQNLQCPNCGAPNSLPAHSRGRCEYCGSSLAAE